MTVSQEDDLTISSRIEYNILKKCCRLPQSICYTIRCVSWFCFCFLRADGVMRTMLPEKLLKSMPILQGQIDALLEFDVWAYIFLKLLWLQKNTSYFEYLKKTMKHLICKRKVIVFCQAAEKK